MMMEFKTEGEILERLIEQIRKVAFDMPAPNEYTPIFVALAVHAQNEMNKLRAKVA